MKLDKRRLSKNVQTKGLPDEIYSHDHYNASATTRKADKEDGFQRLSKGDRTKSTDSNEAAKRDNAQEMYNAMNTAAGAELKKRNMMSVPQLIEPVKGKKKKTLAHG